MKTMIIIYLSLFISLSIVNAASSDIEFKLVVPEMVWKTPLKNGGNAILILWEIKNKTKHQLILPIGNQTTLELMDLKDKVIKGRESSWGFLPYSNSDYRKIKPNWSTYVSAGNFCLYHKGDKLFIGASTARGGWIEYGPLLPETYKLKCMFITEKTPSNYAKKAWKISDIWIGSFTSDIINIRIEK